MWHLEAPEDGPSAPVADPGCRGCGVRALLGTSVQTPTPSAPSSAPPGFAKICGDGETGVRPGPARPPPGPSQVSAVACKTPRPLCFRDPRRSQARGHEGDGGLQGDPCTCEAHSQGKRFTLASHLVTDTLTSGGF